MFSLLSHSSAVRMEKIVSSSSTSFRRKRGTSSSPTTSVIKTNEPSNHIDPAVTWTDEATITLESASPFNAGASERRPVCPGMNAARFFGAALTVSGGKRARAMEGLWVGQAGQERVWQLSACPDWTPENERMHLLSRLKSYTTHHLSVGVGRSVALSNTHTHTHTQVHRIGKSCEWEATGSEMQMEYVQEEKR